MLLSSEETDEEPAAPQLTDRELQVVASLARGNGNKQIARSLGIPKITFPTSTKSCYA